MNDRQKARRLIAGGGVLFVVGLAGLFMPPILKWFSIRREMENRSPLPPLSVQKRETDLAWGEGDYILALSSIGCPYCASWERDELPKLIDMGHPILLRDAPRTSDAVTAALFLHFFRDREERMRLRALAHQSVFGLLRDARDGRFGDIGIEAAQWANDTANTERFLREVEGDRTLFRIVGTPTFARDGFRPLLGYLTAEMLARNLGYSG
jgi:hypothetical protein